jgi:NADPH-dependent curcumin reductase CurA
MQGFIVADLQEKYYEQHQRNVQQWIKDGSLKVRMSKTVGMENAVEGLLDLFHGRNFGKAILQVWE